MSPTVVKSKTTSYSPKEIEIFRYIGRPNASVNNFIYLNTNNKKLCSIRDLLPLQSEYPRKDNQQARELDYKDIQDTYLYKLMYGKQSTKNVWKQLLMPTTHQSPKTYTFTKSPRCASAKKVKEEKVSESFMVPIQFIISNFSYTNTRFRKSSAHKIIPKATF